jgi:hypothetical protein
MLAAHPTWFFGFMAMLGATIMPPPLEPDEDEKKDGEPDRMPPNKKASEE